MMIFEISISLHWVRNMKIIIIHSSENSKRRLTNWLINCLLQTRGVDRTRMFYSSSISIESSSIPMPFRMFP